MCSTSVMSIVEAETGRRSFLRSVGAAAVGLGAAAVGVRAESRSTGSSRAATTVHFENVVDLTHILEPDVPKQAGDHSHPLIFIGGLKTRGGSGSPVRALALV